MSKSSYFQKVCFDLSKRYILALGKVRGNVRDLWPFCLFLYKRLWAGSLRLDLTPCKARRVWTRVVTKAFHLAGEGMSVHCLISHRAGTGECLPLLCCDWGYARGALVVRGYEVESPGLLVVDWVPQESKDCWVAKHGRCFNLGREQRAYQFHFSITFFKK